MPTPKRPLSFSEEIALTALKFVRFPVASWDKRFARDVLFPALESKQLSDKASAQLWRLFIRYRRQMQGQNIILPDGILSGEMKLSGDNWLNLMHVSERCAAPDFRKVNKAQDEQARIDSLRANSSSQSFTTLPKLCTQ